jgi:hypothetical protein
VKKRRETSQPTGALPRLADAITRQPDTDSAWRTFEAALADVLPLLEEDEYLIIESKRHQHYVQFAGEGVHGMRVEAASNAYICDPAEHLSDVQHEQIAALGWDGPAENVPPPNPPPGFSIQGNFYVDAASPVPTAQVAALACATLRQVYGVHHPGGLEYIAFHGAGDGIRFPSLQLRRRVSAPRAE